MRARATLSRYIARHFLLWFGALFAGLMAVVLIIDFVELMRRATAKPDATLAVVVQMALLHLPHLAQEATPFAVLFGGMIAFGRLARSRELVILRTSGLAAWQFVLPALLIAFVLGIVKVTMLNPLAAVTFQRFEQFENKFLRGRTSLLAVSSTGIWLRQADDYGHTVIYSRIVSPQGMELTDATYFVFEGQDRFAMRIDAATAELQDGFWRLENVLVTVPDRPPRREPSYTIRTDLTIDRIQESFASPDSISFWELPRFIGMLERAGFSGLRHRLHYYSLLAEPFVLCAMVLFAAAFTVRASTGRSGAVMTIAAGIFAGFALYFLSDVVQALGLSGTVPVALAAWTPAAASLLIGASLLLHIEEAV